MALFVRDYSGFQGRIGMYCDCTYIFGFDEMIAKVFNHQLLYVSRNHAYLTEKLFIWKSSHKPIASLQSNK